MTDGEWDFDDWASAEDLRVGDDQVGAERDKADRQAFPLYYESTWTVTGLLRRAAQGSRCGHMTPFTRAKFRLTARSATMGTLYVRLETSDKLGNYPGEAVVELSKDVNLAMGPTTLLASASSDSRAWFRGAILTGTPIMDIAFKATYTARRDGVVCWTGANSFSRRVTLTRVAGFAERETSSFQES